MPNTTRGKIDVGGTSTFTLAELREATAREWDVSIVDKVICMIGLGGCRERFTIGEAAWWTVSVALISSGLTGAVILAL